MKEWTNCKDELPTNNYGNELYYNVVTYNLKYIDSMNADKFIIKKEVISARYDWQQKIWYLLNGKVVNALLDYNDEKPDSYSSALWKYGKEDENNIFMTYVTHWSLLPTLPEELRKEE